MFDEVVNFIRSIYKEPEKFIPLHEPKFVGNERKYILDAIDSTYVSSVGKYVDKFEEMIRDYSGAKFAVATGNGTAALHIALILAGVKKDELVITQAVSFVATCNAISYIGSEPLFIDIDRKTLGLSSDKLEEFFKNETQIKNGACYHIKTGKRIAACIPMHTFGHPADIEKLVELCSSKYVPLIEDAAESIGSKFKNRQTGTFGQLGVYSFNGNKTITAGGGGVIITNDQKLGKLAKHLTTQAKIPHRWEYAHDQIGYNYRLPNLNAALVCAQMEQLNIFLDNKRNLASQYENFFAGKSIKFVAEPSGSQSNYWLNAVLLKDKDERDAFLTYTNDHGVMTRPIWTLNNKLVMFKNSICENLEQSQWVEERLVNIPSSVVL